MRLTVPLLLAAVLVCSLTLPARAQSFSCAKASTTVEKLICGDPELSALDSGLAAAYRAAKHNAGSTDDEELRRQERAWLETRNRCQDAECVRAAYVDRLVILAVTDGVFPGWAGTYENWAELQLTITRKSAQQYKVEIAGGGPEYTCDGDVTADVGITGEGKSLAISGYPSAIRAAGTGILLSDRAGAALREWCGARAPQISGFYSRKQ